MRYIHLAAAAALIACSGSTEPAPASVARKSSSGDVVGAWVVDSGSTYYADLALTLASSAVTGEYSGAWLARLRSCATVCAAGGYALGTPTRIASRVIVRLMWPTTPLRIVTFDGDVYDDARLRGSLRTVSVISGRSDTTVLASETVVFRRP